MGRPDHMTATIIRTLAATVTIVALSVAAARAEAWYTVPPGNERFVTFGVAENDETHFGLPLFVCEKDKGISVEVFADKVRASPRWKPPQGRITAELAGRGPGGAFTSGPLPVKFAYNKEREMWTLTGDIAPDNPLWQRLADARALALTVQGKRHRLTTGRLAEALPAFLQHCRSLLERR